jgi:DNA modification methylase
MDAREGLWLLEEGSVHLCPTSPPFNCGKEYDGYDDNKEELDYKDMIYDVFCGVYRALAPGGRLAINVPTVIKINGETTFPIHDYMKILELIGFKFRDLIIWLKARKPEECLRLCSTNWGTFGSPKNPSVRSFNEFILVMYKGTRDLPGKSKGKKTDLEAKEFPIMTNSVWCIPGRSDPRHPAVFHPEVVRRLIRLYTWKDPPSLILDPFAGIGTTLLVARDLGRRYIGFDVSAVYCDLANKDLTEAPR